MPPTVGSLYRIASKIYRVRAVTGESVVLELRYETGKKTLHWAFRDLAAKGEFVRDESPQPRTGG